MEDEGRQEALDALLSGRDGGVDSAGLIPRTYTIIHPEAQRQHWGVFTNRTRQMSTLGPLKPQAMEDCVSPGPMAVLPPTSADTHMTALDISPIMHEHCHGTYHPG